MRFNIKKTLFVLKAKETRKLSIKLLTKEMKDTKHELREINQTHLLAKRS